MAMITAGCGELLSGHLRSVLIVWMSVGGIESLFQRDAALSGEGKRVGSFHHHLVSGKQAGGDFRAFPADFADGHGDADEGVLQLVVFDENEAVRAVALQGITRDAEDVFPVRCDEGKLCPHAGAECEIGIWQLEDRAQRCGVRFLPDIEPEKSGHRFLRPERGDADARGEAVFQDHRLMLRDAGYRPHGFQIEDFHQLHVRLDRRTEVTVRGYDESVGRRFQLDDRRRIAGLAALDAE